MKKLILCGIVTMSFFANIKPASNTQDTWSYQWFSSAIADDDDNSEELEHILIEHKREDEKGGSGGGGSGNAPPGGGGNGQGGGTSDEERAVEEAAEREARRKAEEEQKKEQEGKETRQQCLGRIEVNRTKCFAQASADFSTFFEENCDTLGVVTIGVDAIIKGSVGIDEFNRCVKRGEIRKENAEDVCDVSRATQALSCPAN